MMEAKSGRVTGRDLGGRGKKKIGIKHYVIIGESMNKTSKIGRKFNSSMAVATLVTVAVAAGWLVARSQEVPITGINQPRQQTETTAASDQPQRINKCSQLIGTAVENPQGDRLGKIDEVVVDFDKARVSYCVLSVERGMFAKPKYLAVPLAALQPSADGDRLILNADKDKVAQAQGFDRDNWPSVTNPAWGAQPFWQSAPKATTMPLDHNKNTPSSESSH
jgi:sporulation protein YlmC with PRC-barrel domain